MTALTLTDQLLTYLPLLGYLGPFTSFLAAVFIYYSIVTFYRLTFHPLAKYPGNFIDRISNWPLIYSCYSGHRHLRIYEAHQRYGNVIRIGPNTLDFDTSTAQAAIHKDNKANVRKGDWYKTIDSSSGDNSVQTVIDKKEHAFRRRVLAPAFSETALRDQERYVDENVRIFLDCMSKDVQKDGWSVPRDFSQWITYYGFDFISDLSFGSRFNLLEEADHRYLPDLLKWTSRFLYYVRQFFPLYNAAYLPFAPLVRFILGSPIIMNHIPSQTTPDTHKYFLAAGTKLAERQAAEEAALAHGTEVRRDLFHYLFRSRDPDTGLGFSNQKLQADAGLLIAAGSDGVALTVAAAVFYLLRKDADERLQKLTGEIRGAFRSFDEVGGSKLNRLPYLHAVVEEALRLAPSVPSPFPREVLEGGMVVDGCHIPAGTTVGVSAYSVHHNEEYFPDSFAFRPERWLVEEDSGASDGVDKKEKEKEKEKQKKKESVAVAKAAFCTFSHGNFNCIGKNVAYLASKLVLAKMLYAYDIRAAGEGGEVTGGGGKGLGRGREREGEYQMLDYLVAYRSGPVVQLRARKED